MFNETFIYIKKKKNDSVLVNIAAKIIMEPSTQTKFESNSLNLHDSKDSKEPRLTTIKYICIFVHVISRWH